ncbi:MAG: PAS domain S-box protein, partial [Chthoniobacterales bacterium]
MERTLPAEGGAPAWRQLERAVQHSPEFVGAFDLAGKVLFANAAALALVGLSETKLDGLEAAEFISAEDRDFFRNDILPTALQERRWLGELTFQHFTAGTRIPVLYNLTRVDDPASGAAMHYVIFVRDLSEQKRREGELHDAQARIASVLVAGEVGTWSYDVQAGRVSADANLTRFFSLTPEAAAGGRIEEYLRSIHPEDLPMVEAAIGKAQEEGSTYLAQYRLCKNDGTWRHVIARGTVERDAAGKAAQMPGVVLDITEQVKAQEERQQIS